MMVGYSARELATIRVAVRLFLDALDARAQDFTDSRERRAEANGQAQEVAAVLAKLNRETVG